ncbi:MAG TPA: zf-HC2 domain-containing protein [Candidatus Acidoferrum sp.]
MIYRQITFSGAMLVFGEGNAHPWLGGIVVFGKLRDGVMSCKDTIHLICWYLEGRLSTSVEGEIKRHLETCSDCHLVLDAAINTLERYFNSERTAGAEAGSRAA